MITVCDKFGVAWSVTYRMWYSMTWPRCNMM